MPNDTRNNPEIENFIKDFMANQRALDNAATPEERQEINNRFQMYIEGQYDEPVLRQGYQAIDAMREPKAKGGFPDLNKDGEVTRADVLMGRGVDLESKAEGSLMVSPERQKKNIGALVGKLVTKAVLTPELKAKALSAKQATEKAAKKVDLEDSESSNNQEFLDRIVDQVEANENILKKDFGLTDNQLKVFAYISPDMASYADSGSYFISKLEKDGGTELLSKLMSPMSFRMFKSKHGYKFETEKELNKFYQDYLKLFEKGMDDKLRAKKQKGGSMMVPPEMEMPAEEPPVDTYDNISPEEKVQQAEDMLPDDEMEDEFVDYVAEEVLEPEEQEYLFKVLDDDPKLEGILDKIILNSTEFSGAGEVEGPGTGISDSIPARLSDGEFVFTKKATDQIGADNLQVMMDDAERAYDGGLMAKAMGGNVTSSGGMTSADLYNQPEQINANGYGMAKEMENPVIQQQEDIGRQMMYSSKVPSLLNR